MLVVVEREAHALELVVEGVTQRVSHPVRDGLGQVDVKVLEEAPGYGDGDENAAQLP